MFDMNKKLIVDTKAEVAITKIFNASYENFEQHARVDEIDDLDVAKVVMRKLLDKIHELQK